MNCPSLTKPRLRLVVDRGRVPNSGEAFRALTAELVLARVETGTLDPRVIEYLLAGVGVRR